MRKSGDLLKLGSTMPCSYGVWYFLCAEKRPRQFPFGKLPRFLLPPDARKNPPSSGDSPSGSSSAELFKVK